MRSRIARSSPCGVIVRVVWRRVVRGRGRGVDVLVVPSPHLVWRGRGRQLGCLHGLPAGKVCLRARSCERGVLQRMRCGVIPGPGCFAECPGIAPDCMPRVSRRDVEFRCGRCVHPVHSRQVQHPCGCRHSCCVHRLLPWNVEQRSWGQHIYVLRGLSSGHVWRDVRRERSVGLSAVPPRQLWRSGGAAQMRVVSRRPHIRAGGSRVARGVRLCHGLLRKHVHVHRGYAVMPCMPDPGRNVPSGPPAGSDRGLLA